MMNESRLKKVLDKMEQKGIHQMIITDPASIFYLTGRWILPGERLLALYISRKKCSLVINKLFPVYEDLGVEKLWYSDTDDYIGLLSGVTDHNAPLGVDKNMAARFLLPLMERNSATAYVNGSIFVDEARASKDDKEMELMAEASRLNDMGMERFKQLVKPGVTEKEIAEKLEKIYQELGADGNSFTPIVCFGANCADPHHEPDDTVLKEGDSVLFDVGCKKDSYCADMTRTFFYKNVPNDKARKIYELVRKANEAAEAIIKPGVRFCDIDKAARSVIEDGGYGDKFTHRLGHFIGIDVHDYGDVSSANTDTAQVGNVFSIEPGIYVDGEVGVRIEDLVLVTEDGCKVLNSFPKELQIIE